MIILIILEYLRLLSAVARCGLIDGCWSYHGVHHQLCQIAAALCHRITASLAYTTYSHLSYPQNVDQSLPRGKYWRHLGLVWHSPARCARCWLSFLGIMYFIYMDSDSFYHFKKLPCQFMHVHFTVYSKEKYFTMQAFSLLKPIRFFIDRWTGVIFLLLFLVRKK